MTTTPSSPPAKNQAPGVVGGLVLTPVLHVVATLVVTLVAATGVLGPSGTYAIPGFWLVLGLAQWVYMAPAALGARALGWPGVAKGLWIGGALVTLIQGLCWGAIGLLSLSN